MQYTPEETIGKLGSMLGKLFVENPWLTQHISEQVNKEFVNIELDYKYNAENDPNRFYYRSDHYSFAKNNIPVIFYFNGTHADYHQISDTPDKINYDLLENRSRLIFHTAWEIANREERLIVDKIQEKVKP